MTDAGRLHRGSPLALAVRVVVLAGALAFCVIFQKNYYGPREFPPNLYSQKLRLPPANFLRVATLGFKNLYADLMFLRAIQAYGAGWLRAGESREPILNYFDRVSDVDPHFMALYRFGNLLIADQGGDGPRGQQLIKKGLELNPNDWNLAYLGIYNAIWLMKAPDEARWFLRIARENPETPSFVLRMEEYVERSLGRFDAAFDVNVDYFVRFRRSGDKAQQDLMVNRFQQILDQWYGHEMGQWIDRYIEANGDHPKRIEDLCDPRYSPGFTAATMPKMYAATDDAEARGLSVNDEIEFVRQNSREQIEGLPPEPRGTWYFISTEARKDVVARNVSKDAPPEERYAYLHSPSIDSGDVLGMAGSLAMRYVMPRAKASPDGIPPADSLEKVVALDALGGHFIYDANKRAVVSTALARIAAGQDPRAGARGRGPFPLPLEPHFGDFKDDYDWGRAVGVLDEKGNLTVSEHFNPMTDKAPDSPADSASPASASTPEATPAAP